MPTYDERCKTCGHTEERIRASDLPLDPCAICEGECHVVWLQPSRTITKAKDPYDLLDGRIPASRKVRSFTGSKGPRKR